jgi:phosphoglycolate phosphatase
VCKDLQNNRPLPRFQAVIFDLDGTLVDPFEGVYSSVQQAVRALGYPEIPAEKVRGFIGPPIEDSFRKYYQIEEHAAVKLAAVFREQYKKKENLTQTRLYEGVHTVLEGLKNVGISLALATYKRQEHVELLIAHFGLREYFAAVHGSDTFKKTTKAQIVGRCMQDIGAVPASQTALVGDTLHDAEGAKNVGISFVAVTYGYGFKPSMRYDEAVETVDKPLELLSFFRA